MESSRVEFKPGWDEKVTPMQVLKTICAFANDLHNLNGGYIIIGVAEKQGRAVMPPQGIDPGEIDSIQRWIRGNCNRIDPIYQPVLSPEIVDNKSILVIWVPGSDTRPHQAPGGDKEPSKFFIRIGSESVDAQSNGVLPQLLAMTARVPFDDRRALQARTEDIRERKTREFLRDINSGLLDEGDTKEVYRKLRITAPVNGHDIPKNIGLLLFSDDPEKWFMGSRIEIVQFFNDASGDVQEEKIFRGGIHEQLRSALTYLENITTMHMEKQAHSFRAQGWVNYPIQVLRETLVNAVYHRSYESNPEPTKVYLYSDRIEVISYPGPVHGIKMEHLCQHSPVPPVPARNRRVGEFLKELRMAEGRGTGLPKLYRAMRENGSPDPRFDFNEERTYFRVTLPVHPEYVAISALRDAAHLRAIGNKREALQRLQEAWEQSKSSPALAVELIHLLKAEGRSQEAEAIFSKLTEVSKAFFSTQKTQYYTYDVFLSYSLQDKVAVQRLAGRLKNDGLRVWLDVWQINVGESIPQAIEKGLEESRINVLVLSPYSLGREWPHMERATAMLRDPTNAQRRFVPLLLERCEIPDTLKRFKYIDYQQESESGYQELLQFLIQNRP